MTDMPQYRITFADALTKLDWGTARWEKDFPDESKNIQVLALKNEVCGFQVLARAAADFVFTTDGANWLHPLGFCPRLRLEVSLEDFPQVAGQHAALEVFPIGYIEGDDRRYWMETLERGGYANAPGGRTQGAYVRIRVPKEAPAGVYHGKVRALAQCGFEDESVVWEGEYQLAVADAALPDVKDYAFHLNLWQHLTAIARYHRVALWGAEHFRLIERYYASLAQLGQKVVSIIATEIPWSGQRCYRDPAYPSYLFEHAVIGVERTRLERRGYVFRAAR